jgi:YVTN family beta-propeller protein
VRIHFRRQIAVLVATGVLALLASGGPPLRAPVAEGAATVIATVPSGAKGSNLIAVNPGANLVYVTSGSNDISILGGQPPFAAVAPPIAVGGGTTGVAYDSSTNTVFVADFMNNVIVPFLAVPPFTVLGPPIATGSGPMYVATNPGNSRIYVSNPLQPDVTVLDGAAPGFPFVASLPQLPCAPGFPPSGLSSGIDINPTTNQIYVALDFSNQLWVMDGAAPWGCPAPISVGGSPDGVAYDSANNHLYVANAGSNDVTIIDAATLNVLNAGLAVGNIPAGVAVNPTTNRVYVTNVGDNSVSVIDGSTDTVVQTVPVGSGPRGIAVNPLTNLVFVANVNDNTVSVIEDAPAASPPPQPPQPAPAPAGPTEQLSLQGGACTPVASTYPDATPIGEIAVAVTPPGVLESLWEFDGVTWLGYSPQFPAASNLTQMDRLDVVFICIGGSGPGAGTFTRPVI